MTQPSIDFNVDVYEVLEKQFRVSHLKPALRMAAAQLEHLKPAVAALTAQGFFGGMVAYVPRGTLVIVAANNQKVICYYIKPESRKDFTNFLEQSAIAIDHYCPGAEKGAKIGGVLHAIKKFGAKPGKSGAELSENLVPSHVGMISSMLSSEERRKLTDWAYLCFDADVCPALVVLVGAGSSKPNTYALAMAQHALAPYAESIPE